LKPVDHEYYVMQGTSTRWASIAKRTSAFDMQKAIDERPTYVLFNGSEGALVGDNALTARLARRYASSSAMAAPISSHPFT